MNSKKIIGKDSENYPLQIILVPFKILLIPFEALFVSIVSFIIQRDEWGGLW